jgi:hypothetical protein
MLKTTQNTNQVIAESENGNIRSLIGILSRDVKCEDVFVYTNEDNDLGTIIIGVSDYDINQVKTALNTIELDLVDGFSDEYNMESYELDTLKDLLDTMVYINETNRNGGKTTLELA